MSHAANVHEKESIAAFRNALLAFGSSCQDAVEELSCELNRAVDWFEHDRPAYWKQQLHDAEAEVHERKNELERCLIYKMKGERPQCREEQGALQRAKERVVYCREKAAAVRHWRQYIQHEQLELVGRLSQLKRMVELEVPHGAAILSSIVDRIEDYLRTQTLPAGPEPRTVVKDSVGESGKDGSP